MYSRTRKHQAVSPAAKAFLNRIASAPGGRYSMTGTDVKMVEQLLDLNLIEKAGHKMLRVTERGKAIATDYSLLTDALKVMEATRKDWAKLRRSKGVVNCPRCGEDFFWERESSRGHFRGKCSTDACLSFIE